MYAGEAFTVTLPRKGVDTDERALACDSKDITIEDANGFGTKYTVTAAKAGKYTLKACAFQSATYSDVLKTAEKEIEVGLKATSIAQASVNTAKVAFASEATGLKTADVTAYYILSDGTTKIDVPVKAVAVDSADKSKATVTFYADLDAKKVYTVVVAGTELELTPKAVKAEDAKVIEIVTKEVQNGVDTPIVFKVYTAEGLDVTALVEDSVVITADSTENGFVSGNVINIWNGVGKTVAVKAKADIYYTDADGKYTFTTAEGAGVITSVAAPDKVLTGVDYSVVKSYDGSTKLASDYKQVTTFPYGESDPYYLVAQVNTQTGEDKATELVNNNASYKFESANTQLLLVDATTGLITPVKENVTGQIIIQGTTDATKNVVKVVSVTIGPKKAIQNITFTFDQSVNVNAGAPDATVAKVSAKATYNYGDPVDYAIDESNLTIVRKSNDGATVTLGNDGDKATVTCATEGAVIVKATVKLSDGREFTEQKQINYAKKDKATSYTLTVLTSDNKTTYDTTIKDSISDVAANVSLKAVDGTYAVADLASGAAIDGSAWAPLSYYTATPGAITKGAM